MAHNENDHMYSIREQRTVRGQSHHTLHQSSVYADLAIVAACERPYTKVEAFTVSLAGPSARGCVCRYVGGVQDYVTRGALSDLANYNAIHTIKL